MKKIISCIIFMILLTSIGVNAEGRQSLKDANFTGWWFDKDTQQQNYYKNGDMVINSWIDDTKLNLKYYFKNDGNMATGWLQLDSIWYHFRNDGVMDKGWIKVNGQYYYLDQSGKMLANTTTPDGYHVGSNGAWIN